MTQAGTTDGGRKSVPDNETRLGDPFSTLKIFAATKIRPAHLPSPTTPLINREKEVRAARELLLKTDVRLVTLTGTGGAGKTRLAIEVASTLANEFQNGVFFVSLASITESSLVPSTIVSTLGIMEKRGKSITETLRDYLREKQTLLILDNFEQVISAASDVAVLLAECPRLKMLVTSREQLRVKGEHELPVLSLEVPDLTHIPKVKELLTCAAVALFVQRAQAIRTEFRVTTENSRTIAEICTKLDGLPLALELAAAHTRVLSPEALLPRLRNLFELLTTGSRDLPIRQQTLHNTIEWSYDLLSEQDKRLFRSLSIFGGVFSIEAAQEICITLSESSEGILNQLSRLVEKSLLISEIGPIETRFRMLGTIREFAFQSLSSNSESERIMQRYSEYFVSIVERARLELRGPNQATWFTRLEEDHDNLRQALRRSLENGRVEFALRLCTALWFFWYVRGYWSEGRDWIARTLTEAGDTFPDLQAEALLGAGTLAAFQGDFRNARSFLEESLTISKKIGDAPGEARALNALAMMERSEGHTSEAQRLQEESLTKFQALGDKWGIATALNGLGVGARYKAHYDEAIPIHRQSLELFRELGDKRGIARALANLGSNMIRKGDTENARKLHEESLLLYLEQGDKIGIADSLLELGSLTRRQGSYDMACNRLKQALLVYNEIGSVDGIITCFEEFAACASSENRFDEAARLLGVSQRMREVSKSPIPPAYRTEHEHDVGAVANALGDQALGAEMTLGRRMTLEDAVKYALAINTDKNNSGH